MTNSPASSLPDHDLIQLCEQFKGTLQFLAQTQLNTKQSLSSLPWFILLGPANAGKTSLLAHAESDFILTKKNHQLEPITPTPYCDWWATKQAVYADLSGAFTQTPPDNFYQTLWQKTLPLFKDYYQRNKRLGVMVVISTTELNANLEVLHATAQAVRNQLASLTHTFKRTFPCYLVVNKLDQLTGFTEFFADLSCEDRAQTWEFNCQNSDRTKIAAKFDELLDRLNKQLLFRLQRQTQLDQRTQTYEFPIEIANLKPRLLNFMQQALPPDGDLAWQRVHFASSNAQTMSGQELMPMVNTVATSSKQPNAYFIANLLAQLNQLLAKHQANKVTQLNRKWLASIYLAAGLVAVSGLGLWGYAFSQQQIIIHNIETALAKYQVLVATHSEQTQSLSDKLALLDTLKQASTLPQRWFSAHKINQLQAEAKSIYLLALNKLLLPETISRLEHYLRQPYPSEPSQLYASLQAYLMLNDAVHLQPNFLQKFLVNLWQQDKSYQPSLSLGLPQHLQALFSHELPKVTLKQPLIEAIRLKLSNLDPTERAYAILANLHDYSQLTLWNAEPQHFKAITISQFYTQQNLAKIYGLELAMACEQAWKGNWVLGKIASAKSYDATIAKTLQAQTSELYLTDYFNHWQRVINELSKITLGMPNQLLETLAQFLEPQSLLNQSLRIISNNVQIAAHVQGSDVKQLSKKFNNFVSFLTEPEKQQRLQTKIQQLEVFLRQMVAGTDASENAYRVAKIHMLSPASADQPISELRALASQLPEPWQSWLQQLTANSWQYILDRAYDYLAKLWQQQIFANYQQTLENRFPFNATAENEVQLDNLNQFFGPGGLLDNYFVSYLKPFIDTNQAHWQLKAVDGQKLPLNSSTITALQQAAIIQRMFYPQLPANPRFKFSLAPLAIDARIKNLSLTINGKTLAYPEDTNTLIINWPAEQNNNQVKLSYQDKLGTHQIIDMKGNWALFRLFQKGNLLPSADPKQYVFKVTTDGNLLQFELNAEEPINPLAQNVLTSFKLTGKL